ncbi:hypothetical protein CV133_gene37 [Chlorobiaceae phage CV-1-33]|nr:hypothetical protein CV133_gene37 [Chlorobiaceae phage CV-1-33]
MVDIETTAPNKSKDPEESVVLITDKTFVNVSFDELESVTVDRTTIPVDSDVADESRADTEIITDFVSVDVDISEGYDDITHEIASAADPESAAFRADVNVATSVDEDESNLAVVIDIDEPSEPETLSEGE